MDIFSTLGTSQEPLAPVCVILGSGGAAGGAGKSPGANEAVMEGAAPGVPLPVFLGAGSKSHRHLPCDV